MQFLQPLLLWGTLAIAIPIAIHFWHQKKGTVIDWAATRFLFEKSQQPQRGLRLDQILLLILRCVTLILLAFLLSDPILKFLDQKKHVQTIHLVQPDAFVVDNFRFEVEEARRKGEPIYWLVPSPRVADELKPPSNLITLNAVMVQRAINQLTREGEALHLYLKNERESLNLPFIQTPADFHLHSVSDTLGRALRNFRIVSNQQKLYLNAENQLLVSSDDASVRFASQPVGEGPLRVRVELKNPLERKTAEAALKAFAEVYGLELDWAEQEANATPEVVITDRVPVAPQPVTWYLVTNQAGLSTYPNVVYFPEKLLPQTAPLVANGRLPEWLGQRILEHWDIHGDSSPMGSHELERLFRPTVRAAGNPAAATQQIIFVLLLVVIILERIIALTRNV